ncbi:MAG: hypothetical protein ABSF81_17945 [Bacteroidales bacterium]|jgi:hypothetical protein
METKTDRLNRLFKDWEENVSGYKGKFIKDGIINEPLYDNASKKILFIAKEPNDPDQESWDFREFWNKEVKYVFSYRIAEWSYGLLNDFPPYDTIWATEDSALNAIKQIAFMNIKKTGGVGSSSLEEIKDHLKQNDKFIHEEIEIINPEIIITGLTDLRTELFPNQEWIKSGYDIEITRFNSAKVIDFYHPSSRNAPAASYSLLQNIVHSENFNRL